MSNSLWYILKISALFSSLFWVIMLSFSHAQIFSSDSSIQHITLQSSESLGRAPHFVFQTAAQDKARIFLISQMASIIERRKNNILNQTIALGKEITIPLYIKNIKNDLNNILKQTINLELGGTLSNEEQKIMKSAQIDKPMRVPNKNNFLNRISLQLHLKKFSYNIDPNSVKISEISLPETPSPNNPELKLDTTFTFSKLLVKADDICVDVIIYEEDKSSNNDHTIIPRINENCKSLEQLSRYDQYNELFDKLSKGYQIPVVESTTQSSEWLKNLVITVKDTTLSIAKEAPITLKVRSILSQTENDKGLSLKIDKENTSLFFDQNQEYFDIIYGSDNSVIIDGLWGIDVVGTAVLFNGGNVQEGTEQRKAPILALITEALKELMSNGLDTLLENPNFQQGASLPLLCISPEKLSNTSITFGVDQVSLLASNNDASIQYLGAGFNVNFNSSGVNGPTYSKTTYHKIQEQIYTHYTHEENPSKKSGDIVLSISEEFFNDAIQKGLEIFDDKFNNIGLKTVNLEFKLNNQNFSITTSDSTEEVYRHIEDKAQASDFLLTGCIGYNSNNKVLKKIINVITGKQDQIKIPLLAYATMDLKLEDTIPVFSLNLESLENSPQFLRNDENCSMSKLLKKSISKITSRIISNKFNTYSNQPLVKIAFPALKGLPEDALSIDYFREGENQRINLIISFKEIPNVAPYIEQLKNLEKGMKVIITTPKIDALKNSK